jgi:hypothetical protein
MPAIIPPPINKQISDIVLGVVSKEFGVFASDVFRKTRKREIVKVRQAYFFVMVKRFKASPTSLERYHGHISGTDHANILYSVSTCVNIMDTDPEFRHKMSRVLMLVSNHTEELLANKKKPKSYTTQFKWGKQNYQTRLLLRRMR